MIDVEIRFLTCFTTRHIVHHCCTEWKKKSYFKFTRVYFFFLVTFSMHFIYNRMKKFVYFKGNGCLFYFFQHFRNDTNKTGFALLVSKVFTKFSNNNIKINKNTKRLYTEKHAIYILRGRFYLQIYVCNQLSKKFS